MHQQTQLIVTISSAMLIGSVFGFWMTTLALVGANFIIYQNNYQELIYKYFYVEENNNWNINFTEIFKIPKILQIVKSIV